MDYSTSNVRRSLLSFAKRLLTDMFHPADQIEQQLAKIQENPLGKQRRKAELETKIKAKSMYSKRFLDYEPVKDGKFRCPRCWIMDECAHSLDVTQTGKRGWLGEYAVLHCWRCNEDFTV